MITRWLAYYFSMPILQVRRWRLKEVKQLNPVPRVVRPTELVINSDWLVPQICHSCFSFLGLNGRTAYTRLRSTTTLGLQLWPLQTGHAVHSALLIISRSLWCTLGEAGQCVSLPTLIEISSAGYEQTTGCPKSLQRLFPHLLRRPF